MTNPWGEPSLGQEAGALHQAMSEGRMDDAYLLVAEHANPDRLGWALAEADVGEAQRMADYVSQRDGQLGENFRKHIP